MLQFIDSTRFMGSSLSNLVNNLSEGIHRIKYKFGHDDKKCETCGIRYKYCDSFLKYKNFKDDLIEHKCLCCNKNSQHKFNENLKERFFNTYKFSNHSHNNFILLLRKGVYPYEFMYDWERFNEKSLPEKEDFCSNLNIEDTTDADYAYKYVFINMCFEIYELDPAKFLSTSGIAEQAASKNTKVKLDLLTDIDMLWMVEKASSK